MPHVSVFIPTHRPTYLADALASLVAQTTQDWEAIVLVNGGAAIPHRLLSLDPRIHFHTSRLGDGAGIGALKAEAVDLCTAPVLVELDHDDLLLPQALRKIRRGFDITPEAGLIYSDTLWIDQAGAPTCPAYAHGHGWEYAPTGATSHGVDYPVTPAATPHNVSLIWYAPNHVRAFTRTAYDAVGGYDPTLSVLDDQDLMARLYAYGPFVKTPRPVYVQRVHDQNTQADPETNAAIQSGTWDLYERHLEAMALADAERRGLRCLDLGGAHGNADPRYTVVDQYPEPEGETRPWITATLPELPLPDQSVGVIRAHDFLEHVTDKVALINELHRVLAPGGLLLSLTPSTDGRGAFQDPTHVAFYNEHSFWYYTQEQTAAYVPEVTARFQVSRLRTYFPTPWHAEVNISYVQANLIALHHPDQPRQGGLVGFQEFQ